MEVFDQQKESDCVYYCIYFPVPDVVDKQVESLQEKLTLILGEIQQFVDDYIWQKDPFRLKVVKDEKGLSYPYLHGTARFGDCIYDEWFIVFLLIQISKKYADAVTSVSDNDGEFLLIESAMYLPNWLDSSTSQNRIFIYQGNLHLIPLPRTPEENELLPKDITLEMAISRIRDDRINTRADSSIQDAAFARALEFPNMKFSNMHYARCHIPQSIAQVLYKKPQLIALAVEAFYTRDPIALRACSRMDKFPPSTSITVTVKMTRTLYAQLSSQKFHPPKPFKLPPPSSSNFKSADLGMKVACGFEILCTDKYYTKANSVARTTATVETYPFESDPSWQKFHARLVDLGYYRDEIQGSRLYKELEATAKEQFLKNKTESTSSKDDFEEESPLEQIEQILKEPAIPDSVLTANVHEDDDSWLYINPNQLDSMLDDKFNNAQATADKDEDNDAMNLARMAKEFKRFVQFEEAGIEGAEFIEKPKAESQPFPRTDLETESLPTSLAQPPEPTLLPQSTPPPETNLQEYMEAMDRELYSTNVAGSFVRGADDVLHNEAGSVLVEDENEYRPVDIDLNVVTNLLQSFRSQEGLPGPASTIMGRLGINIVPNDSDDDEDFVEMET
ncbi:10756_t:CDS:10 [Paraglomus brasilianum]|uniref:10756_t:CDS:1 n=1 Tax=Paraglomus brasilianum TaxID=144538 RepID=A0A9N9GBJ4_9GLOM|nr:10756_t:CDS:10 [Paraglomus brasilianum]